VQVHDRATKTSWEGKVLARPQLPSLRSLFPHCPAAVTAFLESLNVGEGILLPAATNALANDMLVQAWLPSRLVGGGAGMPAELELCLQSDFHRESILLAFHRGVMQ
jgi:hypothetical protein